MFQVVCAHTRVWGCGAMLAHAVRPPHHTKPHHTILHPSHPTAPHPAGEPCWQGGPRSSWLPLFSFLAVGPAVGGHCVVLNVNPALPWAQLAHDSLLPFCWGAKRGWEPAAVGARWAAGGLPAAAARSVLQARLCWELCLVNI